MVPLDPTISDQAVDLLRLYRLSHGLLIADALIAATCVVMAIPLLTKNQRDFRFIVGLVLPSYPLTDGHAPALTLAAPDAAPASV